MRRIVLDADEVYAEQRRGARGGVFRGYRVQQYMRLAKQDPVGSLVRLYNVRMEEVRE